MASPLRACICERQRTLVCRASQQQEFAYEHPRLRPFPRRLSRFLVHSGWSGRNAKKLCKQGRVLVNNQRAEAATIVSPVHDIVTVDSNTIAELCAPKVYSMLNKPFNVVSSLGGKDCSSVRAHLVAACPCYLTRERCVLSVVLQDALTLRDVTHVASLPAVGHVGRLDRDSIGALLLTDDGDFSRLVSKPGICTKTYDVSVIGTIRKECLDELRAGGIYIRSIESTLAPSEVENLGSTCPYYAADGKIYAGASTLRVRISEGKHRQVRKMCGYCKLTVVDLCRIAIGPLQLGNLRQGEMRNLSQAELDNIMSAVGGWNIVEQKECESLSSRLQRPETLSTEEKAKIQEYLSGKR